MAYDPGALEAALAAAVGDQPGLIDELRRAFFDGAEQHLATLRQAVDAGERQAAAMKLKSLAASFGAIRLMDAATAAMSQPVDGKLISRIERAIRAMAD